MSGPLAKAALVEYSPTWPPAPVVTVFQYNPETMVHAWSQPEPAGRPGVESANPLAVNGMPGESFEFTIFLNADDDLVSGMPLIKQAAQRSGVGARLAALEMLLYPAAARGSAAGAPRASAGCSAPCRPGPASPASPGSCPTRRCPSSCSTGTRTGSCRCASPR